MGFRSGPSVCALRLSEVCDLLRLSACELERDELGVDCPWLLCAHRVHSSTLSAGRPSVPHRFTLRCTAAVLLWNPPCSVSIFLGSNTREPNKNHLILPLQVWLCLLRPTLALNPLIQVGYGDTSWTDSASVPKDWSIYCPVCFNWS